MKLAVFADLTDQTMPILDFAVEVEARGFTGIFLNEHTHLPVDHSTSRFPGGGPTPERYARFWDPYIALSFVAARTGLEVGTAVSLIGEHDPIALAHQVATLDSLSDGRFVLGVGWGWNREEFTNHGRSPTVRARVAEEWVRLCTELWTNEIAEFEGEFVAISASRMWPKPVQRPRPPVLLGGPPAERNWRRIAAWADGWITMGQDPSQPDFARHVADLRAFWSDAGRPADELRLDVIFNPRRDGPAAGAIVDGSLEHGAERLLYHIYEGDRDAMLHQLDRAAEHLPLAEVE